MNNNQKFKFHGISTREPEKQETPVEQKPIVSNERPVSAPAEAPRYVPPYGSNMPAGGPNPNALAEITRMFNEINDSMKVIKQKVCIDDSDSVDSPDVEVEGMNFYFYDDYIVREDINNNVFTIVAINDLKFDMSEYDLDDVYEYLEENQPAIDGNPREAADIIEAKQEDVLEQIEALIAMARTYKCDEPVARDLLDVTISRCKDSVPGYFEEDDESVEDPEDEDPERERVRSRSAELKEPEEEQEIEQKKLAAESTDAITDDECAAASTTEVTVESLPDVDGDTSSSNLAAYTKEIDNRVPDSAVDEVVAGTRRNTRRDRSIMDEPYRDEED
jgi:hypothetical protein